MEERALNEKESLELIARMIQNSKRNLEIGGRNIFLLWGWLGALVPLVVLGAVWKTGNPVWNWLWFLIPLVGWPVQYWLTRKEDKPVVFRLFLHHAGGPGLCYEQEKEEKLICLEN